MRYVLSLALAIAVAASAVATSAEAGWVGDAIRSQKPQCPPKKPAVRKPADSKRDPR
jgi:hypothetical protein